MDRKENSPSRLNKIEQLKLCHIQLEGNKELILDGCKGIMEYENDLIRICTDTVTVSVTGDDLTIRTFALEQIIISGNIMSLDFS